ncbi:MAG: heavy-metal-associated domain-containing protein [Chitinophagaceae bacterium]|nr:MAG: heavy-metal-associated domain-containing protein [Chitinophagaceae bacterium]
MKKFFLLGLMSCVLLVSQAQFTRAELHATGLTCAMCNNAINKALQALPFIESVKSDIKNSSFHVVFKQGQEVNPDAMKDAVEDAGFSVGKLELYGNSSPASVSNDKHLTIGHTVYHFINVGNQELNADTKVTVIDKDFTSHKQLSYLCLLYR